jgi:hypothetical protein
MTSLFSAAEKKLLKQIETGNAFFNCPYKKNSARYKYWYEQLEKKDQLSFNFQSEKKNGNTEARL